MTTNPQEVLVQGVAELTKVLGPAGFAFASTDDGASGDELVIGEFQRGERRLELHFHHALVLVRYHFDDVSLSHEELVRGVQGLSGGSARSQFPGFSDDPAVAFRHLRADIEQFGAVFLTGGAKAFRALKKWLDKHPRKTGLSGLGP